MLFLVGLLTVPAHADQCAWIDRGVATRALTYLSEGAEWVPWCEPCGDEPSDPRRVGRAEVREVGGGQYHQVFVDGEGIDLAYVFVRVRDRDRAYQNLSKLVDCPSTSVSRSMRRPGVRKRPAALDLPVPSPCAQRWDEDSDGTWESVTHYAYGADRFLETLIRDEGADGSPDTVVTFAHDESGKPSTSAHDEDADGAIDRRSDCRDTHCTTNWIPVCPSRAECSRNEHGLIDTMRFGTTTVVNDYGCWVQEQGLWRYQAPADLPKLP